MRKTLLINPPWYRRDGNIWHDIASVMPPLGLAWLAAQLEREGLPVAVLDTHAERLDWDALTKRLREYDSLDVVGITSTTGIVGMALEVARIVREEHPNATIVLGGVHPTVLPEEVIADPNVDIVVRGEGEMTMLDIVSGVDKQDIDGITYINEDSIVHNPDRELVKDLDSLAPPAYHLLPMDRYYPAAGASKRLPAISMLATRGCPGRCSFCYRLFGKRIRTRSGRRLAEEAKMLQDRFGIKEICFYDDTFTVNRREVLAFLDGLEDLSVDLTWSCFSRVDSIDEELLIRMKNSGCHQIMYGVESASPEILENIGKKITIAKVEEAIAVTKKVGIDVRAAFMIGNPGETKQSLEDTMELAIKLNPDLVVFNIATPFPGTEMFRWADERGLLTTKNWEHYDFSRPIMTLPTLTSEDLESFYSKAYRRFYLRPAYIWQRLRKIRSWGDIAQLLRGARAVLNV